MSVQDYEIEYMEKIGSSSPVSISCYLEMLFEIVCDV